MLFDIGLIAIDTTVCLCFSLCCVVLCSVICFFFLLFYHWLMNIVAQIHIFVAKELCETRPASPSYTSGNYGCGAHLRHGWSWVSCELTNSRPRLFYDLPLPYQFAQLAKVDVQQWSTRVDIRHLAVCTTTRRNKTWFDTNVITGKRQLHIVLLTVKPRLICKQKCQRRQKQCWSF